MRIAFLVGAPRSGTTLLRVMLAGHPGLFSPPEMILAPFTTMAERRARLTERWWERGGLRRALMDLEGIDADAAKAREAAWDSASVADVYRWLGERLHGRMLVDKCPHLCAAPDALRRLADQFPDARWIWLVRHPGSVIRSIQHMPMSEVLLQGYADDPSDLWGVANETLRAALAAIPEERRLRVHYEDLVTDPQPVLERLCALLGLPFHPATLDPYEGDRMREGPPGARAVGDPNLAGRGRIQPELATQWLAGFDPRSAGPITRRLAPALGYDLDALAPPPMRRVSDSLGALLQSAQTLEQGLTVGSDLDAVEGRRFLLRMLAASVDLFVEAGDPDHPELHHAEGPTRKMFADNPDADYWRAPIRLDDGRAYELTGRLPPDATYLGVLLYGRGGRVGARIADRDLPRDADGRFRLRIAADPQADLVGGGDETAVFVRQYFHDRARQAPAELAIRCVPPPAASAPLGPERLAHDLERARRNLEAVFTRTLAAQRLASTTALNRFIPIDGEQLFPTPDNRYLVCWYRLGPDQRLIVRGQLPTARYTSFTLYNHWMESLDYRRARISRNDRQLAVDSDGRFTLVVAHGPHAHPNALDTTGHLAGYLLVRVLLPEGDIPLPSAEVRYDREPVD